MYDRIKMLSDNLIGENMDKETRKKEFVSVTLLFITALLWGTSFAARKLGLLYITPMFFNGLRFLLGGLFIFAVYAIFQKGQLNPTKSPTGDPLAIAPLKTQITGGILMGILLGIAALFQQLALVDGSAGQTAFFVALYTIMVPIISAVFLRTKIPVKVWIGALIAVFGIYLIGGAGDFAISESDIYALLSAFTMAIQIHVINKYAHQSNGLFLSTLQALVSGILNLILGLIFESGNSLVGIMNAFWPLMVCSFVSMGIPYTLQILAQKNAPPSISAIVLSLESVFGAIFGAIILGERMGPLQLAGSALIFSAIIIAQLNIKKRKDRVKTKLDDIDQNEPTPH